MMLPQNSIYDAWTHLSVDVYVSVLNNYAKESWSSIIFAKKELAQRLIEQGSTHQKLI